MFFLFRPSQRVTERRIAQSRALPLSYGPVGLASNQPTHFDIDETAVVIGKGKADFQRARAALEAWKQFEVGWAELFPKNAPVETGTVVLLLFRHLGFWSLNGCRVVYLVGADEPDRRFGFAYGTLTSHAEQGEEIFEVDLKRDLLSLGRPVYLDASAIVKLIVAGRRQAKAPRCATWRHTPLVTKA